MTYSISEAAEKCGMTAYTLRFYDKEGLLPFVDRDKNGRRIFKDKDFDWLSMINCMKATGMQIKDIRTFVEWSMAGDEHLKDRLNMLKRQKSETESRIKEMQNYLDRINFKIWYTENVIEAGTESIFDNNSRHEMEEAYKNGNR